MHDGDEAGMKFVERVGEFKDIFNIEAMTSISGKDPCEMNKSEVDQSYENMWDLNKLLLDMSKEVSNIDKVLSTILTV